MDLHAWIKVKWKSLAKVPEPRRIKVQLHGDLNQSTRMLRNFCAEKRCVASSDLAQPNIRWHSCREMRP